MPSSKESVRQSPTAREMARASMIGGSSAMSCVASTMIVVSVRVIRVIPPSTAAEPMTAKTPTSLGSQRPERSTTTSPKSRPSNAPMAIPGIKLPEGRQRPKARIAVIR
jgi:hypothetical protein